MLVGNKPRRKSKIGDVICRSRATVHVKHTLPLPPCNSRQAGMLQSLFGTLKRGPKPACDPLVQGCKESERGRKVLQVRNSNPNVNLKRQTLNLPEQFLFPRYAICKRIDFSASSLCLSFHPGPFGKRSLRRTLSTPLTLCAPLQLTLHLPCLLPPPL